MVVFDDCIVLSDFKDIWFTNCDARYRALKGARSTGKTYQFIGLEAYFKIFSDDRRNILMVRQNDKDNAQSNYTILKNVAHKYGFAHLFQFTKSPYKITYKRTGQVILFAGMNDVENITGTSVESGYWTDIYFEEASQLKSYEEFRVVDGSIRVPNYETDLKVQITFLFNAWDIGHWLYDVFFKGRLEDDVPTLENNRYQFHYDPTFNIGYGDGLALHISSYKCNPYLSEGQIKGAQIMKEKAYDIYLVENLGCWGALTDRTYSHWDDSLIVPEYHAYSQRYDALSVGIDFGMSNGEGKIKYSEDNAKRLGSANTMQLIGISDNWGTLEPIDEYFDSNEGRPDSERKTSYQIQTEMIKTLSSWIAKYQIYGTLVCYVDCADSGGFIDGLIMIANQMGLSNVVFMPSSKIPILSRVYFENLLMAIGAFKISKVCTNLIREIRNARKAKDGRVREDYDDHAINAFEYAWIPLRKKLRRWKSFKDPLISESSNV
jgi:phage terminase large subunit